MSFNKIYYTAITNLSLQSCLKSPFFFSYSQCLMYITGRTRCDKTPFLVVKKYLRVVPSLNWLLGQKLHSVLLLIDMPGLQGGHASNSPEMGSCADVGILELHTCGSIHLYITLVCNEERETVWHKVITLLKRIHNFWYRQFSNDSLNHVWLET